MLVNLSRPTSWYGGVQPCGTYMPGAGGGGGGGGGAPTTIGALRAISWGTAIRDPVTTMANPGLRRGGGGRRDLVVLDRLRAGCEGQDGHSEADRTLLAPHGKLPFQQRGMIARH